ncbi:MAG: helix-turn-helix transcriptional regulator [Oscillospiraceae bacterium]|nr:helix-turn-helix transcriptional regulator [Oscillospiraceae bacterium]
MERKNTCVEVFGKRLKELRKANGYTIEQFADMVGISKSTLGYYENDKRMPDIEILTRIADTLNVNADYLIGRTNTTALKGKMKTVCEFTGLSDNAAEYLAQLVKDKDYAKLSVINHLFDELTEDYDFYSYETQSGEDTASSVLGALFLYFERCSGTDSVWDEFGDLGNDRRKEILAAAYKQFHLNQVTELVKSSAEAYRRDNEPIDR